ncbi:MAG: MIP/aquaporin family protein, partial [Thermoplasmata archaeon]
HSVPGFSPQRALAEIAGTALLVGIGTASIVAGVRWGDSAQWLIAVAWFAAVTVPVVTFVSISGAHLNPAITLSLALSGRLDRRELPPYVAAQVAGAFLGSALVWATLGNGANLGATTPVSGELGWALAGEGIFTLLLVASVFYLADRGVGRRRWRLLLPGTVVGVSTYLIGPISGSSLNPARSIAPAVLSGVYTDLLAYIVVILAAGALLAFAWKPKSTDILDRGVGRLTDRE